MEHWNLRQIVLVLTAITFFALTGCAQQPAQGPSTDVMKLQGEKVTIKGKIGYMINLKTYIVRGEAPPDVLFIVNQDPKLLEELMKSEKTVIIEGYYTIGADHLFIEKIDGKAYQGKE